MDKFPGITEGMRSSTLKRHNRQLKIINKYKQQEIQKKKKAAHISEYKYVSNLDQSRDMITPSGEIEKI